ncbi:hypothetical protein [Helicobacter sp. 11S03491-1]|uniref:hypothetical protein n=1 Tax=Helicobacter sp. 11S03491-1 TaxID=1476196 RepID=UPI000BA624CC|nr:hypothetical protein [Helicobacter sp. 11S03491-1]PAF42611.1 hypothetical protein BKH45_03610 [Helicobacter sp. 11S03491-1]
MKKFSHTLHLFSSIFFLPLAFVYAFSGILFLVGYYGNIESKTYEIQHDALLDPEEMKDFLLHFLQTNHLKIPHDKNLKPTRDKQGVQIGIMSYIAQIRQKENILTIKTLQRDPISNLLALHFAQGRWYFDVLGVAFGSALVIFYFTGILMIRRSKHKKALWITFFAGLCITILTGYFSGK